MCDLGCGFGFIPYLFGELLGFKEVYGIDINEDRLAVAEKRLYKVLKADLEDDILPFPKGYFNLIISFGVLEHLKFFDNPIKEAYRILKPGGLFLVSIPNLGDWVNKIRLLLGSSHTLYKFRMLSSTDHIRSCTLSTLERLLMYYGLSL